MLSPESDDKPKGAQALLGPRASVRAHSAISFRYKHTMLPPESDRKTLEGTQALLQPRATAQIPCYICQPKTTRNGRSHPGRRGAAKTPHGAVAPWAWEHTLPSFFNINTAGYHLNPMKNPQGDPSTPTAQGKCPNSMLYLAIQYHTRKWPLRPWWRSAAPSRRGRGRTLCHHFSLQQTPCYHQNPMNNPLKETQALLQPRASAQTPCYIHMPIQYYTRNGFSSPGGAARRGAAETPRRAIAP